MKKVKIFLVLVILFSFLSSAYAINWSIADQKTVGWDAVTTIGNDEPIPSGDVIKYRVYISKMPSGEEQVVGDTDQLQYTITFTEEGKYIVGVQTVRIPQGETEEILSSINWSNSEDIEAVPVPFGIKFFVNPSAPKGFGPK